MMVYMYKECLSSFWFLEWGGGIIFVSKVKKFAIHSNQDWRAYCQRKMIFDIFSPCFSTFSIHIYVFFFVVFLRVFKRN